MDQPGLGTVRVVDAQRQIWTCDSVVTTLKKGHKKPGLEKFHRPGSHCPGLFSDLFNVAASRPAQITTG